MTPNYPIIPKVIQENPIIPKLPSKTHLLPNYPVKPNYSKITKYYVANYSLFREHTTLLGE